MNFRFLDLAEEEMTEAARIYEDQAVGLGERFLDEVEGCVDLLLDRPYIREASRGIQAVPAP